MVNRIFTVVAEQPVYLPGELSRKILLMLDGVSLHQARQVCQGWDEAILNLLWGAGEDRVAVERKLKNNWSFAAPVKIERTLKIEGFYRSQLLSLTGNRAVMMFKYYFDDPDNDSDEVKIVEFNTKDGKVVSTGGVPYRDGFSVSFAFAFAYRVENTMVLAWHAWQEDRIILRVLAYNLQTQQISFDRGYKDKNRHNYKLNETAKEIHIGRTKLKIANDNVIEEEENYPPDIVAIQSDLCITQEQLFSEAKLWRRVGKNYEEISVLHPGGKYRVFHICLDTSRIVSVSSSSYYPDETNRSLSIWNSETGNLIQEETLPPADSTNEGLRKFKVEGNHLVLLVENGNGKHIVIYELDKVLAGEYSEPRKISLGSLNVYFWLVEKTCVTFGSCDGTVVKLDFWRC